MSACPSKIAALCAGLLVLAHLDSAHGQSSAPQEKAPAGYEALIDQALGEYDAHDFADARALLTQAHLLYPNARTLRGLGMAEFELRNYGDCIQRLEAALASTVRPREGELRRKTEELLARARTFVARYEISLQPAPSRARVVVDGVPVELAAGQALTLTVGEHVLQVQAAGYQEAKRSLSVSGCGWLPDRVEHGDLHRAPELHWHCRARGVLVPALQARLIDVRQVLSVKRRRSWR